MIPGATGFVSLYDESGRDVSMLQVFSLSVSEIGTLVSLGPRESCEFFHDPNKGKR